MSPYNLDIVHEKVDDKQYETSVEFLKDIRQIRHNAEIVISGEGTKQNQKNEFTIQFDTFQMECLIEMLFSVHV